MQVELAEFDDTLITGDATIDSQHKELIDKINALLNKCAEGDNKLGAVKMLDYLAEYTEFHFTEEEKLQEKIDYPGLAEHKKKHDELRRVVAELNEMLDEEEGPTDKFVEQVQKNVVNWLYGHIKSFDRSFVEYMDMRANGHL